MLKLRNRSGIKEGKMTETKKRGMQRSMRLLAVVLVFLLFLWLTTMAEGGVTGAGGAGDSSSKVAAVHIVYTEKPEGEEPEDFHLRTLSTVLGSEEAAKEALIYSYKTAASGFSAKLTAEQVAEISKQPGVLQVVPSRTLQLHSGPGKLR